MRTPELPLISDYPAHYAAERPDADALVMGETKGQTLNWQQFEHAIDRCARALAACGVERGDRVAMLSAPRSEYLIVYMATARIGAIWQGLNPRQTYAELAYLVGDSQPKVLLGIEAFEDRDFTGDLKRLQEETDGIRSLHFIGEHGLADFLALRVPKSTRRSCPRSARTIPAWSSIRPAAPDAPRARYSLIETSSLQRASSVSIGGPSLSAFSTTCPSVISAARCSCLVMPLSPGVPVC